MPVEEVPSRLENMSRRSILGWTAKDGVAHGERAPGGWCVVVSRLACQLKVEQQAGRDFFSGSEMP